MVNRNLLFKYFFRPKMTLILNQLYENVIKKNQKIFLFICAYAFYIYVSMGAISSQNNRLRYRF